ncbi:MAG: hypothetical protein K0M64_07875, partial [Rhizobium sp.]|nr:hypothetical protein [Rhizobium sp.]
MVRWLTAALLCLACVAAQASAPRDAYPSVAKAYWVEIDGRPPRAGPPHHPQPQARQAKQMNAQLLAAHGGLDGPL